MLSFEGAAHLDWAKEIQGAVTICDRNATILYMNDKALKTFQKNPADNFLGKSLYDCHSRRSRDILQKMLQEETNNFYTIEKKGVKKLIAQIPWRQNGQFMGLVEISLELPAELSHYVR